MSRIAWIAASVIAALSIGLHAQQPAPQPAPTGDVVGIGNFAHIVADVDRSLGFYRDVLGLSVSGTIPFAPNDAVAKFGHTEGGQSRVAVVKVPGLAMGIELIEYKDIARTPQNPRFHDPGAANMAMRVRNLDALFPKIASYPGVKVLSAGAKPATIATPNATMHVVFIQDPDGFVVELADAGTVPADAPAGPVIAGSAFEATVRNSEETVKFYKDLLGFGFTLGDAFNDNQQMAATAGAPGASFRQSRARFPGTTVPFTLIEFKNIARKELSGRTQDPGTTVVQLIVKDVTALTAKLKAAGVPIVTTGGEPVQVGQALKIAIVRDPNNMLLELVERAPRSAQQVTKKDVAGISTFAQVESTIACGGATTPDAMREIKRMGFKTVVNLRLASEQGALVEEEGAMVRSLGMNYVHLPFNIQTPDAKLVANFIAAVAGSTNTPAYVHCAAGGRAAALWMIKRVKADGWSEARALEEANALGLNDRLRPFALNYLKANP